MRAAEEIRTGTRVKYVGASIAVAELGEEGTVIAASMRQVKWGELAGTTQPMYEVAWDAGATSYCWAIELEIVADFTAATIRADRVAHAMGVASRGWVHVAAVNGSVVSERVQ
jgi:hypothetical protein